MFPYSQIEAAAKKAPPPKQKGDDFPTAATVTALYLTWALLFSKRFQAPDTVKNAQETIARVSNSKLVRNLRYKWQMTRVTTTKSKEKAATEKAGYSRQAWDSYHKNIQNTVYGTCSHALARRELNRLPQHTLIKWLPSKATELDAKHVKNYFKIMTVGEAVDKELCIRIGCKCGWLRM